MLRVLPRRENMEPAQTEKYRVDGAEQIGAHRHGLAGFW